MNKSLREAKGYEPEIIYVGFNRRVSEISQAAVEEDADVVAASSYNGGHCLWFPALSRCVRDAGSSAAVVGGGGGTIVPDEVDSLAKQGIRIYDQSWSLSALAEDVCKIALQRRESERERDSVERVKEASTGSKVALSRLLSAVERAQEGDVKAKEIVEMFVKESKPAKKTKVVVVTGVGGGGKSTTVDEVHFLNPPSVKIHFQSTHSTHVQIVGLFSRDFEGQKRIAVLCVDPTTEDHEGRHFSALLGDRIRMNNIYGGTSVFMRSIATREAFCSLPASLPRMLDAVRAAGCFDVVVVETPGTGQVGLDLRHLGADLCIYVKTKEFGSAAVQLAKDQLFQTADVIVLNKIDREGSHAIYDQVRPFPLTSFFPLLTPSPLYAAQMSTIIAHQEGTHKQALFATIAKVANTPAMINMYVHVLDRLGIKSSKFTTSADVDPFAAVRGASLVPHKRRGYLGMIVEAVRKYDSFTREQVRICRKQGIGACDPRCQELVRTWQDRWKSMTSKAPSLVYTSFNGLQIPRVSLPDPEDDAGVLSYLLDEGLPGEFPYVGGVFPLKQESAVQTTRQFAGLRLAEHTNARFRLLSEGVAAPRLSTAFDGVTLYGDDSDSDPGTMAKIGEGGVAISSLDDMKILYSGFDFRCISTSMTINGPAAIILAMYFNTACDFMIDVYKKEHPTEVSQGHTFRPAKPEEIQNGEAIHPEYGIPVKTVNSIRDQTFTILRGTVQADILKEMQAQNEVCLRMTSNGFNFSINSPSPLLHTHTTDDLPGRFRDQTDGGRPGVLRQEESPEVLLDLDQRISHRRGGSDSDPRACVHADQRVHLPRELLWPRDASQRHRSKLQLLPEEQPRDRVARSWSCLPQDLGDRSP